MSGGFGRRPKRYLTIMGDFLAGVPSKVKHGDTVFNDGKTVSLWAALPGTGRPIITHGAIAGTFVFRAMMIDKRNPLWKLQPNQKLRDLLNCIIVLKAVIAKASGLPAPVPYGAFWGSGYFLHYAWNGGSERLSATVPYALYPSGAALAVSLDWVEPGAALGPPLPAPVATLVVAGPPSEDDWARIGG